MGVRGESFDNDDGTSRQEVIKKLRKKQKVELVPDPLNPHGRWSVKVLTENKVQIGWLPSDARDASALLKGEPIHARIYSIKRAGGLWKRLSGSALFGVVLEISKDEPNWDRHNQLEKLAKPLDKLIEAALKEEQNADVRTAIKSMRKAIQAIREFTIAEPHASAYRKYPAPVDRLSLLLEKEKNYEEALKVIDDWQNIYDPVQPTKGVANSIRKRRERLLKRVEEGK